MNKQYNNIFSFTILLYLSLIYPYPNIYLFAINLCKISFKSLIKITKSLYF